MKQHKTRPTSVWVLPPGFEEEPQKMTQEKIREIFNHYSGSGYEPKLEWLHEAIDCTTVDFRDIPDVGHVWFDEEFHFKTPVAKLNYLATLLYQEVYDRQNVIMGRAVLVVDPDVPEESADAYVRDALLHLRTAYERSREERV